MNFGEHLQMFSRFLILHVLLREWTDVLLIVYPSVVFAQKIIDGRCDDLVVTFQQNCCVVSLPIVFFQGVVVRAWDFASKGIFFVFSDSLGVHESSRYSRDLPEAVEGLGITVVKF